ncbi:hypothetical protein ATC03_00195 [Agromyces aureus]|uniref:Uncharacterized protein n=2 Tax=Agromyces aureus TaxID=453304 RepID=A0A191WB67_9MICO|nr:hypothetical protein ATC03_00195 [Agromyces aureus]
MSGCLQERGWDAKANDDGSYDTQVLPDQAEPYEADRQDCLKETGYAGEPEPLSRAELADWYQELLVTAECARGLGYDIADAPSAQVFLDQVEGGELDGLWGPYPSNLSATDFAELEAACPQPGAAEGLVQAF